jgi:hypothetical protein
MKGSMHKGIKKLFDDDVKLQEKFLQDSLDMIDGYKERFRQHPGFLAQLDEAKKFVEWKHRELIADIRELEREAELSLRLEAKKFGGESAHAWLGFSFWIGKFLLCLLPVPHLIAYHNRRRVRKTILNASRQLIDWK